MRRSRLHSQILALGTAALLATGCGREKQDTSSGSNSDPNEQGTEGFFHPMEGETWKYKVQKEVPLDLELAEADALPRPERTDSGYLITSERVRTCRGSGKIEGTARPITFMDISEDGVRLGQELYDIGPKGVFFRGWKPADGEPSQQLLEKGVKLATPNMEPGQNWTEAGVDPDRRFVFRVIERTEVDVPAGKFDTLRIQISTDHDGGGLKRTIWFAANVGIVKEESVYYGPQRTRVRETAELVHFMVPTQAPPGEEARVILPDDRDDPAVPPDPAADQSSEDDPSGEDLSGSEPSETEPPAASEEEESDAGAPPGEDGADRED